MGKVEVMVAGWGRVRERGGPAPGPGWQMTPACRPNVPVGFLGVGGRGGLGAECVQSRFVLRSLSSRTA